MDGRSRKFISPGLRVAVVLKEDQPTGRRTYGEVGQILTPSDYHPHGIKVRLRDGQVGRVQEIMPPLQAPAADRKKQVATPDLLVVLAVKRPDCSFYGRSMVLLDSNERLFSLGLDAAGDAKSDADTLISGLRDCVTELTEEPRLMLATPITIGGQKLLFQGYLCSGSKVADRQKQLWQWTGWLSADELQHLHKINCLSEESALLYDKFQAQQ